MIHVALELCKPGDMMVVDLSGLYRRYDWRFDCNFDDVSWRKRAGDRRGLSRRGRADGDAFPGVVKAISAKGTIKATPGTVNDR